MSRLQQIPGMPDLIAEMVAASNACMRAWEMGNEAEYRALTTPNFRMVRLHFSVATRLLLPGCFGV